MDDQGLIQEIEEDLQRQRFEALWKKYGPTIIGVALVIVLGTASFSGFKAYVTDRQQKASYALMKIAEVAKKDERIALYESFVKDNDDKTQAVLARFLAAEAALSEGKKDRAIAFYDALAEDKGLEPVFRGLANILSVLAQFDSGEPARLEEKLKPLLNGGTWHPLAYELTGHLAIKAGDRGRARKIFTELLGMKEISPGIQRRVANMIQWLNGEE